MEDCKFALQFLVDTNMFFNMCTSEVDLFRDNETYSEKDMELEPSKRIPEDIYDFVYSIFSGIIIEKLNILSAATEIDDQVMPYVRVSISKIIENMKYINRVKMERMMVTIRLGINSNCKFETTAALADLEFYVNIFYQPNRRFFTEDNKTEFIHEISKLVRRGNKPMIELLNKIQLSKVPIQETINVINKSINKVSVADILKIVIEYSQKVPFFDTPMNAIGNFKLLFKAINDGLGENKIFYSNICITTVLIDNEMYVYYYGFLDNMIAGCFSLDFIRLKSVINNMYTDCIFYFVVCCICLTDKQNSFNVQFDIESSDVKNMFIFLQRKYLTIINERISEITSRNSYIGILKHLSKFIKSKL